MRKILKKSISILLATLCAFNLTVVSFAEDTVTSGTCGANASWSFDEVTGTLTISGTGKTNSYLKKTSVPWYDFRLSVKAICIENGITEIGDYLFSNCSELSDVEIPDSVVTIGNHVFEYCSNLKKITLGKGLKTLGRSVFFKVNDIMDAYYTGDLADWCSISIGENSSPYNNGNLYISGNLVAGDIVIPDGVTSIGSRSFSDCDLITSIEIPDSVGSIGAAAFSGCSNLTKINLPEGIKTIASRTFAACPLESITIPDGVQVIGSYAFSSCSGLTNIVIPDSVTAIDDYAFNNCTKLKKITLGKGLKSIGDSVFFLCNVTDRYYTGDLAGWCSINRGEGASPGTLYINGNPVAGDVAIPDGVTSIGSRAFSGCHEITGISVPDSVQTIGSRAFSTCSGLTEVIIGSGIKSIGEDAFISSDNLEVTYYTGTEEQWNEITIATGNESLTRNVVFNYGKPTDGCGENATWAFDGTSGALTISGTGTVSDYSGWKDIANIVTYVEIGNGITAVGEGAFNGFTALKEVYLAESVTELGVDAFADCLKLTIVTALSDALSFSNAFSDNDSRLFFVAKAESETYSALKSAGHTVNGISTDREKDGHKVLSFEGKTTVYKNLDYNYISNLIADNSDAHYLYFDKVTFEGIAHDIIIVDEENLDSAEEYFTLNEVYISVSVNGKTVSLPELAQLLQSEDADGIISFEQKDEPTIFEQISDFFENTFDNFVTEANRVIISVINAIKRLFRR